MRQTAKHPMVIQLFFESATPVGGFPTGAIYSDIVFSARYWFLSTADNIWPVRSIGLHAQGFPLMKKHMRLFARFWSV
jgi:hypothetical protein